MSAAASKCPRDGTALVCVSVQSLKLEKCHRCDGLWFDQGELAAIRHAKLSDVEVSLEQEYGNPSYEIQDTAGYMQCPKCDGRLQRVYDTGRTALEIDRCEDCQGIWLDDGELDQMTAKRRTVEQSAKTGRLATILRSVATWLD